MAAPAFNTVAAPKTFAATLFFSGVVQGDVALVRDVLASNPDAVRWAKPVKENDKPFATNETGLMLAAQEGHVEVMRVLIDAGAELNARQSRRWTPLMYAAERSRADAVGLLLAKGANTALKNEGGDTAATMAAQRQDFALARQINNALKDHGLTFFQKGQQAIVAPATARWKKKP
jgi:hypothetical protein